MIRRAGNPRCLNWLCFNDSVKHPGLNDSANREARGLAKIRILLRCAFASSEVYEHIEIAELVWCALVRLLYHALDQQQFGICPGRTTANLQNSDRFFIIP